MPDNQTVPVVDEAAKKKLGARLYALFEQYKKDRREAEEQWLKNLRQFKGIYDPEVEKKIPADQSKAYPKITRTKVIATVARLMEMLFPQTEKNWGIEPSPLPDVSEADLQTILDELAEQQEDPNAELTEEQIEKAIAAFAKKRAERMSIEIDDQLDEIHYVDMARRIVFSAVLYSHGILFGPMVKTQQARTWARDPYTGKYKATTIERRVPYYEVGSVWDWYPDMSAKRFEQMDGSFTRAVLSRHGVSKLASRPDFDAKAVKEYLRQNQTGNYKELHWETELRSKKSDRANVSDLSGRKYEAWSWWGVVSGHELRACGVGISDEELSLEVEANVWGLGEHIIKAVLNPYDEKIRPEHVFVYEDDEINLLGNGLPPVMRDSQMAICEASRMLLDNASVVCGDMMEINTAMLMPGQSLDIYARRAWLREDIGVDANIPAVRAIKMDSHLPELQSIVQMFLGFADTETALPPPALGDVTKGGSEAMRTSGNASMFLGAAALPIRDTVRNFDRFTTSFISSLYHWNMQFNTKESIKGDYAVIARGSTSLIAKEVRSYALDSFAATLTPEERAELKTRKLLEERMKVRDLPLDLLEDPAVVDQLRKQQADEANQDKAAQTELLAAEIKKTLAEAFKDVSLATKAQVGASVDSFNATVEGIARAKEADQTGNAGTEEGGVPRTARAGAAGAAATGGD